MFWKEEPRPAHWRIRSRHASQDSRTDRWIYLTVMFLFSLLWSAFIGSILVTLTVAGLIIVIIFAPLIYATIFFFFPVYAMAAILVIWGLHFLKIFTGFGPDWLKQSPRGYIEQKAEGFRKIAEFALTWRRTAKDESEQSALGLLDSNGPYDSYDYLALPIENDQQVIRVLDLFPGQRNSPLRCRIRHISLKLDDPAFEAISYCWGGQQPSIPVYIDDAAGPRQILATRNLVEALQQFRQSDQQRTVWVDGLCINQAKEAREERVRQVKLMGVIYQKAQHCLIWLGRGPKDAAKYLDAIKQLNQIEAEFNAADVNTDPVFMSPEEKIRYNIPYGQTPHLRGLQLILSSAWLTRVWIVQEASLARQATIYLGDGSVTWDELVTAQSFAGRIALLHQESQPPIDGMKAIRLNRIFQSDKLAEKGERDVLALFARFRHFDASVAEDKINGLISLMPEELRSRWLIGEYTEQAFINAAHHILHHSKSLDLLGIPRHIYAAARRSPAVLNIPSWVPDWNSKQVPVSLRMLEFGTKIASNVAATQNSSYDVQFGHEGRLLGVNGYRVCAIQNLGDVHLYQTIDIDISGNALIRKRVRTLLALVDTYFDWHRTLQLGLAQTMYAHSTTPMTTREAFLKTIVAYAPNVTTVSLSRLTESFNAFDTEMHSIRKLRLLVKLIPLVNAVHVSWVGAILITPYTPLLNKLYNIMSYDPETVDFNSNMVPAMGRRMARTDDGHFALVPGNATVGDEITLLKGASAPIVMRKRLEDDNWEHVGEAYVEGLMTGDGWDERLCEKRWLA